MNIKQFLYSVSVFLILLLPVSTSMAEEKRDGNELLKKCQSSVYLEDKKTDSPGFDLYDVQYCFGMLRGVVDTITLYQLSFPKNKLACVPNSVTNGQVARVVVKYLKKNPERLHERDATLMVFAFMEAFPCKK